jgi:4-alpha-glucanotransferase
LALALVFHHHQPSGNLGHVFEHAFERAYAPLITTLEGHPSVHAVLHYSGSVLEWLRLERPAFLARLRELLRRGQIEVLGGAMFEPILVSIGRDDQIEQIRFHANSLEGLLGGRPNGMWLTERVWEPHLPAVLAEAGMRYTLLGDEQFATSGAFPLTGHYLTEEQGKCIALFPIQTALNQVMLQQSVAQALAEVKRLGADSDRLIIFAGDAEKFGALAGSEQSQQWLGDFLAALEQEKISTTTLQQHLDTYTPLGQVYLPSSAHAAMNRWSLPSSASQHYLDSNSNNNSSNASSNNSNIVQAGHWRQFLLRYPEAGQMHHRARYVSEKIRRAPRQSEAALLSLWRAQTGDAYWHGDDGGVYWNFLRSAVYQNLIEAENAIEPRKYAWLDIEYRDFDLDGFFEVIAESHTMNLYFKPSIGGMLTEFDYRPKAFNLLDTFSRRAEHSHRQWPREQLIYDHYPRRALVDHFIGAESKLSEFVNNSYLELGDFTTGVFEASKYRNRVTLTRMGAVRGPGGAPVPVELKKAIKILAKEGKIEVEYRITNHGTWDIITRFGSEWSFGLLAGNAPDRYYTLNGTKAGNLLTVAENLGISQVGLVDEWRGISIEFDFEGREVLLWRQPIETPEPNAQGGLGWRYQASTVLPLWDLDLPVGRSRRIAYTVTIKEL